MSPSRITHALVVVPARDEETLIGRCLDALDRAVASVRATHPQVVVRTLIVADACTDDTEGIVRSSGTAELVVSDAGRVGAAREHGVRLGLASFGRIDPAEIWIANTDADSAVPDNWLTHQLDLADEGTDVLVGTVRPDPADLTAEQDAAWLATHERGRPNGHVHGANLGLRASAHLGAGGFDAVEEHEDNLLVRRLQDAGAAITASDSAEVVTSGRASGRTPGGYAAYLARTL
ncbi:glycosyltransferase [Frondihabitans peucedani]|uniref:4,4'-diaponeurosporenoate glycosyltransferase n=1 Tax=Frondihabitans peucedani TaxID=598626 RepID=A0ABP8E3X2_9MICO